MTTTTQAISICAGISESDADDLLLAVDLALGIVTDPSGSFEQYPLGLGSSVIDFAASDYYAAVAAPQNRTYGKLARAFLNWRLSKNQGG